jgi:hypothetical protein
VVRAADWLFVIGLSTEIGGGALIAGETLLARREEIAARGMTFPSGSEPTRRAQRGAAFTWTGVVLLVTGFVVQLVGYVVGSDFGWFFLIAPLMIVFVLLVGWRIATTWVQDWLHDRAGAGVDAATENALDEQRERKRHSWLTRGGR